MSQIAPKIKSSKTVIRELDYHVRRAFERLVKISVPRREKLYQLVKMLASEAPPYSIKDTKTLVSEFYSLKFEARTAKQISETFQIKPYPWLIDQFYLTFLNGIVSETEVFKSGVYLRPKIQRALNPPADLAQANLLHLVVFKIVNPRYDQLHTGIDLPWFTYQWRTAAFSKYGDRYDYFFKNLECLQKDLDIDLPSNWPPSGEVVGVGQLKQTSLALTQTDLDWMQKILAAINIQEKYPKYPLARGPKLSIMRRLEDLTRISNSVYPQIVKSTNIEIERICIYYLKQWGIEVVIKTK